MPKYLEKRRRRWYAVLDVPKDVRDHFGKARLLQSLETESLSEAERRVPPIIALWKAEIQAARSGSDLTLEELAKQYQSDIQKAKKATISKNPVERYSAEVNLSIYDDLLNEEVEKIGRNNPSQAEVVYLISKDLTVVLSDHVEVWLAQADDTPKTIDMKRWDVRLFTDEFRYSHQVQKQEIQRWVHQHQVANNLADATMKRMISACKGYWSYLQQTGIVDSESYPFNGLVFLRSKKSSNGKSRRKKGWTPFSPEHVVELYRAADAAGDEQLRDTIAVAMWTGCRIEEICSLKVQQVHDKYIEIIDAKSDAGDRKIPIHKSLKPVLENLSAASSDGYVISNLTPNKYGDRSNALGKRFGRLKTRLGHDRNEVFHSIRKTVATLLENAEVPENVSADILGHEKQTMTYGLYSGGAGLPLMAEAIQKLKYPI